MPILSRKRCVPFPCSGSATPIQAQPRRLSLPFLYSTNKGSSWPSLAPCSAELRVPSHTLALLQSLLPFSLGSSPAPVPGQVFLRQWWVLSSHSYNSEPRLQLMRAKSIPSHKCGKESEKGSFPERLVESGQLRICGADPPSGSLKASSSDPGVLSPTHKPSVRTSPTKGG